MRILKNPKFKTLKIVQLVDSLDLGGTERMSVNIANSLAAEGMESYLLVTRRLGGLANYVSPVVTLKAFEKSGALDLFAFIRLLKYLREINPDILHVHQTSIFWAVFLKPFLKDTHVIWHDHFGQSEMLDQYPRKEMNFIFPYLSAVITVNSKIQNYWIERFPAKSENIYFLRNFPELKEINRQPSENSEVSIINVSNIRKQKDQVTLIESLALLKEKGFQFKAYLIGQIVEPEWLDEIKVAISKHKLSKEVTIVGPVNDIVPFLKGATLGVLSSESEGLPVALLEYGMASLPTVSTRVGQCEMVLGDGEFGWLVPPKAPVDMAEAMEEILTNPESANQRGRMLNSHIRENYGPKNFMNHYFEIIDAIANVQFEKRV